MERIRTDILPEIQPLSPDMTSAALKTEYRQSVHLKETENLTSLRLERKIKESFKNKQEAFEMLSNQVTLSKLIQHFFEIKCPTN